MMELQDDSIVRFLGTGSSTGDGAELENVCPSYEPLEQTNGEYMETNEISN